MASPLATRASIPIAELSPNLLSPSTHTIKAVVTLIWPYSSSNSSLKILLAEPDFRLRRIRGQVRVNFSGSSARAASKAGIGSGDEIILSLEGVEWIKDVSATQTPGRSVEWELKYTGRLLLQIQENGSEKISIIDIDHAVAEPETSLEERQMTPELVPSPAETSVAGSSRPGLKRLESNEWDSPAFVKRARLSYGSLFGSGHDIFAEEHGIITEKTRKRTRFGRESGAWRYESGSSSPEASPFHEALAKPEHAVHDNIQKPIMTDEGCQTTGPDPDFTVDTFIHSSRQPSPLVAGETMLRSMNETEAANREVVEDQDIIEHFANVLPPIHHDALDIGAEGSSAPERIIDVIATTPLSPRLLPISSDVLPLVSPLSTSNPLPPLEKIHELQPEEETNIQESQSWPERSKFGDEEIQQRLSINESEDLYGFSPVAHSHGLDASYLTEEAISIDHDILQPLPNCDGFDCTDQHGQLRGEMAAVQGSVRSASHEHEDSGGKRYPETEIGVGDGIHTRDGQYFDCGPSQSPTFASVVNDEYYPDIGDDSVNQVIDDHPNFNSKKFQGENLSLILEHGSAAPGNEEHGKVHHVSNHHVNKLRTSAGGLAMSRSQSVQSELIDLTEDSDLETEDSADESQIHDQKEIYGQIYIERQIVDQSEDGDGKNYQEENVEEGEKYEEDQLPEDDASEGRSSTGYSGVPLDFHPGTGIVRGESEDYDEDMVQDEDDYYEDEEESSDEEDHSARIKQLGGKPEVIDLLSSDEDDDGNKEIGNHSLVSEDDIPAAALAQYFDSDEVESDENSYSDEDQYVDEDFRDESAEGQDPPGRMENTELERDVESASATQSSHHTVISNSKKVNIDNSDLGERAVMESRQTIPSPAMSESRQYLEEGELRKDFAQREVLSYDFGGGDGAVDDQDMKAKTLEQSELRLLSTALPPIEENTDVDITHPDLPTRNVMIGDKLGDNKVEHAQKNHAVIENHALVGGHIVKDNALKEDHSSGGHLHLLNNQLPTPDATQSTAIGVLEMPLEYSFGPQATQDTELQSSNVVEDLPITSRRHSITVVEETANVPEVFSSSNTEVQPALGSDQILDHNRMKQISSVENSIEIPPSIDGSVAMTDIVDLPPRTPQKLRQLGNNEQQTLKSNRSSDIMDEPATPDFYDASVELAIAALESPTQKHKGTEPISDTALRVKLSRPLRTSLGIFTTLKLVKFNLEKKVDILAIVTSHPSEPQRSKGGPRHFQLHFKVTDASLTPSSILQVHIFRPFKIALPNVRPGDGVLLRNFIAKSEAKASFALRSDEGSSWAVFKDNGEEEVRGPPMEFGDEEREHVESLKSWYRSLDKKSRERLDKLSGEKGSDPGKGVGIGRVH